MTWTQIHKKSFKYIFKYVLRSFVSAIPKTFLLNVGFYELNYIFKIMIVAKQ